MSSGNASSTTETATETVNDSVPAPPGAIYKGDPDGLYQAVVKGMRSGHIQGRMVVTGIGFLTDKAVYMEVLAMFYIVTKLLEEKLNKFKDNGDEICTKLVSMGFCFSRGYESDLELLYGSGSWSKRITSISKNNAAVREYVAKIEAMTKGTELAGAAACLWGALIVGGSSMVASRVRNLVGDSTMNLYKDVIGPGRQERRRLYVDTIDSLAKKDTPEFDAIVCSVKSCIECNNNMLASCKTYPKLMKMAIVALLAVIALSLLVWMYAASRTTSSDSSEL